MIGLENCVRWSICINKDRDVLKFVSALRLSPDLVNALLILVVFKSCDQNRLMYNHRPKNWLESLRK